MALKTRYTVVNGEILSENRSGTIRDYVPDPLGSTVALLDNTQVQKDTFTYWPYGEVKNHVGSSTTPFQFVGTLGYYTDSVSKTYVRARYLDTQKARWLTQDPLEFQGGDTNLYRYVAANPVTVDDPSGLQAQCLLLPLCGPAAPFVAAGCVIAGAGCVIWWICNRRPVPAPSPISWPQPSPGKGSPPQYGPPTPPVTPGPTRKPHRKPKPKTPPYNPGRDDKGNCIPCRPGTVEIHYVPPSTPHYPCPGSHWVCVKFNQSPDCECHPRDVWGGCIPPPAPATC